MIDNKDKSINTNQIILKVSKEWAHMRWGNLQTEQNIDLLVALLKKFQTDGLSEYTLQFEEVVGQLKLMQDGSIRVDTTQLDKNLTKAMNNIATVTAVFEDENNIDIKTIFSRFKFDKKNRTLFIKWNTDNIDLVKELSSNALYLHRDFYRLNSKYAKIFYIALSEWNNIKTKSFKEKGICSHYVSKEELLHLMGLENKKSYIDKKNGTTNIMQKVIKPSIAELQDSFINLTAIPRYKSSGKVRSLIGYNFLWYPHQYIIDEKQKNAIEMKKEGLKPIKNKNSFNNFSQRDYDWDKLEKELLSNK